MFKVIATILLMTVANPDGEVVGHMSARSTFDTMENCQAWLSGPEGAQAKAALDATAEKVSAQEGVHYGVKYQCEKQEGDDGSL